MRTTRSAGLGRFFMAIGVLVIAGLLSGCGATMQARKTTPSGFLGDYSQLKPGDEGEALFIYVNPDTLFSQYNKILLDPVRVYASKDGEIARVPREDLQKLVNYFGAALREQLKEDYSFVE